MSPLRPQKSKTYYTKRIFASTADKQLENKDLCWAPCFYISFSAHWSHLAYKSSDFASFWEKKLRTKRPKRKIVGPVKWFAHKKINGHQSLWNRSADQDQQIGPWVLGPEMAWEASNITSCMTKMDFSGTSDINKSLSSSTMPKMSTVLAHGWRQDLCSHFDFVWYAASICKFYTSSDSCTPTYARMNMQ